MNATDAIVTHSPIICAAINRFTTGGHPEAMLADPEISKRGRLAAEAAIKALEAEAVLPVA